MEEEEEGLVVHSMWRSSKHHLTGASGSSRLGISARLVILMEAVAFRRP